MDKVVFLSLFFIILYNAYVFFNKDRFLGLSYQAEFPYIILNVIYVGIVLVSFSCCINQNAGIKSYETTGSLILNLKQPGVVIYPDSKILFQIKPQNPENFKILFMKVLESEDQTIHVIHRRKRNFFNMPVNDYVEIITLKHGELTCHAVITSVMTRNSSTE